MSVSDEVFEYWLEVSGKVKRGGTYQSDDGDEVGENTVFGRCAQGRNDSFLFTGESVNLRLRGPGKVLIDGEVVKDTTKDDADGDRKKRKIRFLAAADEPTLRYQFSVTGEVARSRDTDDGDVVSGNTVTGAVGNGRRDTFFFTGKLETLRVDGVGKVLVDGKVITDTTRDEARLPKEAIVSSPGTDEFLAYTFEVTGNLVALEPEEDSDRAVDEVIDMGDRIRVEGGVTTGDDRFAFSGDLIPVDVPEGVQIKIRDR